MMIDNNYMLFAHKLQASARTHISILRSKSCPCVNHSQGQFTAWTCQLWLPQVQWRKSLEGGYRISMEELKRRILAEGKNLGKGILKVDSFINHQIDTHLMFKVGRELARRFADAGVTKVLTAEISGIAPALATAHALNVPIVYARKTRPVTMTGPVFVEVAPSHTKGSDVFLMLSTEFLAADDRVLVVDDFLASGATIAALVRLVEHAGATLVGIGAAIEKGFEAGREELAHLGVPIVSLAVINDMSDSQIVLA